MVLYEKARESWCLTFNQRSDIAHETMDMYSLQTDEIKEKQKPKEIGASQIKRYKEVVKLLNSNLNKSIYSVLTSKTLLLLLVEM